MGTVPWGFVGVGGGVGRRPDWGRDRHVVANKDGELVSGDVVLLPRVSARGVGERGAHLVSGAVRRGVHREGWEMGFGKIVVVFRHVPRLRLGEHSGCCWGQVLRCRGSVAWGPPYAEETRARRERGWWELGPIIDERVLVRARIPWRGEPVAARWGLGPILWHMVGHSRRGGMDIVAGEDIVGHLESVECGLRGLGLVALRGEKVEGIPLLLMRLLSYTGLRSWGGVLLVVVDTEEEERKSRTNC
ncbi:hypothetical protein EV421DRAFT_1742117 [Armillaria borealis]|uniref:Uncharacterized protein n=1 Tax=Armillaria borealis TaxID=47425 RepID=A0AA39IZJ7_9AGAR|nr:hypothetical protein EV421DRAFT_1742117 [Armillaria borealis]